MARALLRPPLPDAPNHAGRMEGSSMKVLFVTPPYHCGVVEVAGRWIPLQFVYLAGAARAAGHECEIFDAMSLFAGHEEIGRRIDASRPDVVAISAITATFPDALEVARAAKASGAVTVLGGVHPTFMYPEFLRDGAVDFASISIMVVGACATCQAT